MAPKQQQKQRKAPKAMLGQDKETILRVEPYLHFGKHALRPYVDGGLPIYLSKGVTSEKKFLTISKVLARADAENSELCRRPQKGMSMTSSCVQGFADFCATNKEGVLATLKDFIEVVSDPQGQELVEACKFFNQQNDAERDLDASKRHVDATFKFFEEHRESLEKIFRKATMVSSRTYLAATSIFELLAT